MRRIYGVEGTTVIINMAPVPTCDTLQQTYRRKSEGLRDNAFETLPITDFNEGDVHFSPEGGRHISIEAGNQILALEEQRRTQQPLTNATGGRPMSFVAPFFFLVFLPLTLIGFQLAGYFGRRSAVGFLSLVSLYFYYQWSHSVFLLLLGSIPDELPYLFLDRSVVPGDPRYRPSG